MTANLARLPKTDEAQLLGLTELALERPSGAAPLVGPGNSPLLDVKARLQVCVGEASMTIGALLGAKAGHVVTLDRRVEDVVDVLLEGRVVARGELVAVGDHFGIRITELPLPLKL